ncbi:DUF4360 domain-containing protein [Actinosynnema sp. NPDC047251]|uniref:Secreted protein n=1 Tax=Saccharothrix espanaensis (strain ATCC 51144 / DSM 44229 / JCM 9112 / NBRC 15066 / NRRL 15764) TaxID=1179773 RepID=K0K906_SACES|nr:DUF4360 domain-containing protein [Saccharothrix espanaensis]CCH33324.1 Secreted protein [Saccharothrix espanaensis DSM 44229]
MLNFVAAAALASTAIIFPPGGAPGDDAPPPGVIYVKLLTVNGSGCKPGTAAVAVSDDRQAFTVSYSDYLAKVGPGAAPADLRKNCQLNLEVHVPQGFTYGIAKSDYRGFGKLERGASGTEKANYYFQGMSETTYKSHTWNGPLDDNWEATDEVPIGAVAYAPCGEKRNFNINTELRVSAGTSGARATSFMTMDSTDTSLSTTYHFAWKVCP